MQDFNFATATTFLKSEGYFVWNTSKFHWTCLLTSIVSAIIFSGRSLANHKVKPCPINNYIFMNQLMRHIIFYKAVVEKIIDLVSMKQICWLNTMWFGTHRQLRGNYFRFFANTHGNRSTNENIWPTLHFSFNNHPSAYHWDLILWVRSQNIALFLLPISESIVLCNIDD